MLCHGLGVGMRRREFIGVLGIAATAWPFAVWAQSNRVAKIGALLGIPESDPEVRPRVEAFLNKLRDIGWKQGRDYNFDVRFGGNDAALLSAQAKELVASAPDVILSQSNQALASLLKETHNIPIVGTVIGDPVGSGFIKSLSRPGGNVTGFTSFEPPLAQKWVQSLKEISPGTKRAGVILLPETPANVNFLHAVEVASASLGMTINAIGVHNAAEIERLVNEFARQPDGGLVVLPSPITNEHRALIVALAARHHLPAIYAFRYFAVIGGLMSYGIDVIDLYKRAAVYVDRILKGAKPADLPMEQPTKFELVINLKTAKALGLSVPPAMQARADEMIE
jgi:putative tryptophan/tyrosine transport system substrate-binding protein